LKIRSWIFQHLRSIGTLLLDAQLRFGFSADFNALPPSFPTGKSFFKIQKCYFCDEGFTGVFSYVVTSNFLAILEMSGKLQMRFLC